MSADWAVRSEKFNSYRLAGHARALAEAQVPAPRDFPARSIAARLTEEWTSLLQSQAALRNAAEDGEQLVPAAEWLIDNFHVLEQQYRQIQADLPPSYYRQLPKIGPNLHLSGYPLVFGMAWAYVAHTDSLFDTATFIEFVNAYQEVRPLAIGELWALPIHLRITLLENAARVARRTVISRQARAAADALVGEVTEDESALTRFAAIMRPFPEHARLSFLVQVIRRLRDDRGVSAPALALINRHVHQMGHDFDSAIHDEHARLAANNVTMQNLFTSLKSIGDQDWEQWFRAVSHVDHILGGEAEYAALDPATRSSYRRQVEDLARHSRMSEEDIAKASLSIAGTSAGDALMGSARRDLERRAGYHAPTSRKLRDAVRASGVAGYGGAIILLALAATVLGLSAVLPFSHSAAAIIILAVLTFVPACEAAAAMVNYAITRLMKPVTLPALSFETGIPEAFRTMIAVPVLLDSFHAVDGLVQKIESHALSNPDDQLFYALVSDWKDAGLAESEDDRRLLRAAVDGIAALNAKHGHRRFMLFHRARRWNPGQRKWMGWERKRGKLHELNTLLRGNKDTSFIHTPEHVPDDVRLIIVLDADTVLPRGAARKLVGKMAHPLNRPVLDEAKQRVVSGYGIMQPRVTISVPERGPGTIFQRIFSSRPGIDPYVFAVSDVYQDLFGEGTFTGKGIYDIDAFEAAIRGRVPDNTMLSHDLFEGSFARAALVSDVEVVEDFPERYLADAARHHRWARGDWQLLPWMWASLFKRDGLSALGLWKTADNLRRSLTPPFTLAALVAGCITLPPSTAVGFTLFLMAVMLVPSFLPILASGSFRSEAITVESQALTLLDDLGSALRLTGARLLLLAHQAWLMADAAVRTLFRLFISRRNLLEWTTAAQAGAGPSPSLAATYRRMAAAPVTGVLILLAYTSHIVPVAPVAIPFAIAWMLSPAFAWWISQPPEPFAEATATASDIAMLRQIARRTWRYFEIFVTPGENMLPPDNFQEDPNPVVAHRTSPTNIGLYLISTVSAHEMGWIGRDEAVYRISATLDTMKRMEMHRGHLFNWYDTRTLAPLEPRYVSTVDSGNLSGHLIALANACAQWQGRTAVSASRIDGIADAARIVAEEWRHLAKTHRRIEEECKAAIGLADGLLASLAELRGAPDLIAMRLVMASVQITGIEQAAGRAATALTPADMEDLLFWTQRLRASSEAMSRDATASVDDITKMNARLGEAAATARVLAYGMDFAFLMNTQRELLSIGYQVREESLDQSCYDLLASEAALTSFLAVAKGDARLQHWFRLGRPVVAIDHAAALVSWSGSMFEYLMPNLVLNYPHGTLLRQTLKLIVRKQIAYGRRKKTPWGISEAGYAARDLQFTYQYLNFGVPGLGLKRGLEDNHVIAPYATGLASMVLPAEAAENYAALEKLGARGRFGFYEFGRLHAVAAARGRALCHRTRLFRPSSGHDDHRDLQRGDGWRAERAVSR
ncbi:glucoamylase family protein [Aestuariivirga sp.]|uniref:glucoamylase family protein n=1 Tax=Aestuariivirga sp. TaxID=2650926 RepID=UPI0039E389D3